MTSCDKSEKKNRCNHIFLNLFFVCLCAGLLLVVRILPKNNYTANIFKMICFTIFQLFEFTLCNIFFEKTDYKKKIYVAFKNSFKKIFFHGVLFSILKITAFIILLFLLRSFLQKENTAGYAGAFIILSLFFFLSFSAFWFFAEFQNGEKDFISNLKNSFKVFLYNPFFTCKVFFVNSAYAFISIFTFFIFPGISGIMFRYCRFYKELQKKTTEFLEMS